MKLDAADAAAAAAGTEAAAAAAAAADAGERGDTKEVAAAYAAEKDARVDWCKAQALYNEITSWGPEARWLDQFFELYFLLQHFAREDNAPDPPSVEKYKKCCLRNEQTGATGPPSQEPVQQNVESPPQEDIYLHIDAGGKGRIIKNLEKGPGEEEESTTAGVISNIRSVNNIITVGKLYDKLCLGSDRRGQNDQGDDENGRIDDKRSFWPKNIEKWKNYGVWFALKCNDVTGLNGKELKSFIVVIRGVAKSSVVGFSERSIVVEVYQDKKCLEIYNGLKPNKFTIGVPSVVASICKNGSANGLDGAIWLFFKSIADLSQAVAVNPHKLVDNADQETMKNFMGGETEFEFIQKVFQLSGDRDLLTFLAGLGANYMGTVANGIEYYDFIRNVDPDVEFLMMCNGRLKKINEDILKIYGRDCLSPAAALPGGGPNDHWKQKILNFLGKLKLLFEKGATRPPNNIVSAAVALIPRTGVRVSRRGVEQRTAAKLKRLQEVWGKHYNKIKNDFDNLFKDKDIKKMLGGGCRHMKQQLEDELKIILIGAWVGSEGGIKVCGTSRKVFTWPALEVPGSGEEEGGGGGGGNDATTWRPG